MSGRRPVVFLFAGQGSQYYGMGADLLASDPVFRAHMRYGDRFLADLTGHAVLAAIHEPGRRLGDPFDQLSLTHPAIVLTQFALAKTLEAQGVRPDAVAGVSLGEITAMAVAGMLPFEAALSLSAGQPGLFSATCPPGAMVACLTPAAALAADPTIAALTERAGIGGPRHTVLAVPASDLDAVTARLAALDVVFQVLPVPFAFHSRWIDPAGPALRAATGRMRFRPPAVPVFSGALRQRLSGAESAADLVWSIVRGEMRFAETLAHFEAAGGADYVDLSPSGTLAGLARQALDAASPSTVHAVLTPLGTNLANVVAALTRRPAAVDGATP